MSSLIGILCLLSALAATSYSYWCIRGLSIGTQCSGNNITCPSGEACGSSYTKGSTGGKNSASLGKSRAWPLKCNPLGSMSTQQEKIRIINSACLTDDCDPVCEKVAVILAWTYSCASKCNFLASMRLQQAEIKINTLCYHDPNCTLNGTVPKENSIHNGLGCPSCISANSTWCHTDETVLCRGDETMCLLMQTTQESGSMSTSTTAFRGCATKSFCDLGSQSQNKTGLFTQVKFNCTRASTSSSNSGSNSGSTSGSTSGIISVLNPAIVCLFLQKLLF